MTLQGHCARKEPKHSPLSLVGEELAGSELSKAGLGSQSSAEPLGFCITVLQHTFDYVKPSTEPS